MEIASRIRHPNTVAAFAAVLAAMAFLSALKARRPKIAVILALAILVLGLAPLASSTFLASRGIYHIRIVVLEPNGEPTGEAKPIPSVGGDLKQGNSNWEFDLAPQTKPLDGKVTFYASMKDAYLSGSSTITLAENYYPTVTVQLRKLVSVTIRGTVVDGDQRSVKNALVSVPGFGDIATTDEMGNFSLPAHAAEGELITVRAQKGDLVAEISVIAGKNAELVLRAR